MYNPYSNFVINPWISLPYQPQPEQPRESPPTDPTMCHYTVKFFDCNHRTDDNVKGCSRWEKTGTHCDIDNPAVRKRDDCSVRTENVKGLCSRCQSKERERLEREREEELIRRDLEKAKIADQEEQRRNAEAHEAHMRRVQEESEAEWRAEHEVKVSQDAYESVGQWSEDLDAQEVELLSAVMEASRKEYEEQMQERFRAWKLLNSIELCSGETQFDDGIQDTATAPQEVSPGASSADDLTPQSPPWDADSWNFSPPSSPASALSRPSDCTIDTNIDTNTPNQTTTRRTTTTTWTTTTTVREPTPPPSPPSPPPAPRASAPAFPPIDFSQPPKDQEYGHHFIGGRRQPVHQSQKLAESHPLSPMAPAIPASRKPQSTTRLAGGIVPSTPSPTSSVGGFSGLSGSTQRPSRVRPPPKSPPQEEPVNELQAMWNRKGIKRETDEDDDESVAAASITPSESASQIGGGASRPYRGHQ